MKVKFFANYDRSVDLLKRFIANYPINDDRLKFTLSDDYDCAVVFNRADEPIKTGSKIITVIQEPSWSPAHGNLEFLKHSDVLLIHDRDLFERTKGIKLGGTVIESPAFMFYHDHVEHKFFEKTAVFTKERKLSVIMSGLNFNHANYKKRINLLRRILQSDLEIDIYGKYLSIDDRRYKGFLDNKFTGLLPYEYSIAIENSNERNYITEKFVDCLLCNTVPIYNGAPNVGDVYDDRYFKTIDLDSSTIIDDIKQIISQPALGSVVNKEVYFSKFNLYTKLTEIIFGDF